MTIVETRARSRAESTPIWMSMSPPRSTPTAGCSASSRSRRHRPGSPRCTTWLAVVRCRSSGSGSRAPAPTGPAWPAIFAAAGVEVIEVDRPNRQAPPASRQVRHDRRDRSGPGGAVGAGRRAMAKTADGNVEAIRVLLIAKRSARDDPHQVSEPAPPSRVHRSRRAAGTLPRRAPWPRWPRPPPALRPNAGGDAVVHATKLADAHPRPPSPGPRRRRGPPRRRSSTVWCKATAPSLLASTASGSTPPPCLLVAAGDNAERIRSEAAFAHLCGVAPIHAIVRQDRPPPAQPRRQPPSQPRPVADRVHPHGLRPNAPAPTSNAASPKDAPSPRSCASSSATSPARSTATCRAEPRSRAAGLAH